MTVIEALIAARALLAPRGAWTQRKPARDASGAEVFPLSDAAVCWCLHGALFRVCGSDRDARIKAETALGRCVGVPRWRSFVSWNDWPGRRKASVLRLIDRAIAKAGGAR